MSQVISSEMQDFYSSHSCMSDPGLDHVLLEGLPSGLPDLVKLVQGLILHLHWVEKYGVFPSEIRRQEANLRSVSKQLERIMAIDLAPLTTTRVVENRILGTCRDYSVFLSALLRNQGIPARARCGFGAYFTPGRYEDHWICEYWKADEERWVMVDAQLDALQRKTLGIDFDSLDVPADRFLTGGKAWQLCRREDADPNKFGVFNMRGLWFVRGNLVRDVASLNKMELLPWDCWALSTGDDDSLTENDFALLDQVAPLTLPETFSFTEIRSIYQSNKGLKVPPIITSFTGGKFQEVDLTEEYVQNPQLI